MWDLANEIIWSKRCALLNCCPTARLGPTRLTCDMAVHLRCKEPFGAYWRQPQHSVKSRCGSLFIWYIQWCQLCGCASKLKCFPRHFPKDFFKVQINRGLCSGVCIPVLENNTASSRYRPNYLNDHKDNINTTAIQILCCLSVWTSFCQFECESQELMLQAAKIEDSDAVQPLSDTEGQQHSKVLALSHVDSKQHSIEGSGKQQMWHLWATFQIFGPNHTQKWNMEKVKTVAP